MAHFSTCAVLTGHETLKHAALKELRRLHRLFQREPTRELAQAIQRQQDRALFHHDEVERLYAAECKLYQEEAR